MSGSGGGKGGITGSRIAGLQANTLYAGPSAAAAFTPTQGATTQNYLAQAQQFAQTPNATISNATNSVNGILGSGGVNANTQAGLNNVGGIASGAQNISTGGQYQTLANGTYNPNSNQTNLQNYANGSQIGANNDTVQKYLADQDAKITDQQNLASSLGGRYGSGAYQGLLTGQLASTNNAAIMAQYNQDVANQFNANAAISGEQQNGYTDRLNAINGLTGVQGQNISNQMNAAGMQIGAGQQANAQQLQAAGMAPDMYQLQQAPLGLLGQVGAAQDAQASAAKLAPYNALNSYASVLASLNGAKPAQQASGLQQGIGAATAGAGILGAIF